MGGRSSSLSVPDCSSSSLPLPSLSLSSSSARYQHLGNLLSAHAVPRRPKRADMKHLHGFFLSRWFFCPAHCMAGQCSQADSQATCGRSLKAQDPPCRSVWMPHTPPVAVSGACCCCSNCFGLHTNRMDYEPKPSEDESWMRYMPQSEHRHHQQQIASGQHSYILLPAGAAYIRVLASRLARPWGAIRSS
jgi:hypothetical protein